MFWLGVNYWPRAAGVQMWDQWDPQSISHEFDAIQGLGCRIIRVFILWSHFQTNPETVAEGAMERFAQLLNLARERDLQIIPTFTVGHMSGENWDVPWREGRDVYADPEMLRAQCRLVGAFARRFGGEEVILAWDLANEPEIFARPSSAAAGWLWVHLLARELEAHDPAHPVTVGLCLDSLTEDTGFHPPDLAESLDFLCMHAYPVYTDLCPDRVESLRCSYLPAFACLLTEGLGGKKVFFEEFGLGDHMVDGQRVAGYYRAVLPSLLLNGSLGALGWCATDFSVQDQAPYERTPYETSFGLLDATGRVKAAGEEVARFARLLERFGPELEPATNGVFILLPADFYDQPDGDVTPEKLTKALFNAFLLAKRAGLNPAFCRADEIPAGARLLIAPCIPRRGYFPFRQWRKVLAHVEAGAGLYLSYAGLAIEGLAQAAGVRILGPDANPGGDLVLRGLGASFRYRCNKGKKLHVEKAGGEVLLEDAEGTPAATISRCGQGWMTLATHPLEEYLAGMPNVYEGEENTHLLYRRIAAAVGITSGAMPPQVEAGEVRTSRGRGWLMVNHGNEGVSFSWPPGSGKTVHLGPKEGRIEEG